MIGFLANVMVVEIFAEDVFEWAKALLGDGEVSSDPTGAPALVAAIQSDEKPHVEYLRTALSELRARTLRSPDGEHELDGRDRRRPDPGDAAPHDRDDPARARAQRRARGDPPRDRGRPARDRARAPLRGPGLGLGVPRDATTSASSCCDLEADPRRARARGAHLADRLDRALRLAAREDPDLVGSRARPRPGAAELLGDPPAQRRADLPDRDAAARAPAQGVSGGRHALGRVPARVRAHPAARAGPGAAARVPGDPRGRRGGARQAARRGVRELRGDPARLGVARAGAPRAPARRPRGRGEGPVPGRRADRAHRPRRAAPDLPDLRALRPAAARAPAAARRAADAPGAGARLPARGRERGPDPRALREGQVGGRARDRLRALARARDHHGARLGHQGERPRGARGGGARSGRRRRGGHVALEPDDHGARLLPRRPAPGQRAGAGGFPRAALRDPRLRAGQAAARGASAWACSR